MFPTGGFGTLFTFNGFWPGQLGGFYLGGGIGYVFQKDRYYGRGSYWRSLGDRGASGGDSGGSNGGGGGAPPGGSIIPFESYSEEEDDDAGADWRSSHLLTAGLNVGYKFVLSSGLYFRTGAFIGLGLDFGYPAEVITNLQGYDSPIRFYMKPDLAIGWTIR
jgi:hypothetical protein